MSTASRALGTLILGLVACGGGSSDDGDIVTPPPPPPTGQTVQLTLVARSLDPNADAGQIYAYIGDATITRAQMAANLNENAPTLRYIPGSAQHQVTVAVPRGKAVTLFAVEFGAGGATIVNTSPIPQTPPTKAPRTATEFVRWESTGQAVATPEPGVATLTANSDVTVTANYDLMIGYPLAHNGCLDLKVQVHGPGPLTFGPTQPDPLPDLTSTNGFVNFGNHLVTSQTPLGYAWAKQGSTVTLRAAFRESRVPMNERAGFMSWSGAGTLCGTNQLCQITIPVRGNSPGPVIQQSSWGTTPSVTQPSCPVCVNISGCVLHP